MSSNYPTAIIDVGTGFTKMGLATNANPQYCIPSYIGTRAANMVGAAQKKQGIDELDFLIGDECLSSSKAYPPERFMSHGIVTNWDLMEKFYEQCFYKYLRINPEEYNVILTEPPLNTPENREYLAEVMFETFNVPGVYIAVQAVLAICATWVSKQQTSRDLTGCVVDSGDGVTHIIPVSDGVVIPSAIKHIPIAGNDFTKFIQDMIREREKNLLPEDSFNAAREIKESLCYTCGSIVKEFEKYDANPTENFKSLTRVNPFNKQPYTFDVGYERFLTPEIFFHPEIYSADYSTPLQKLVDSSIQQTPVDCRRKLYNNIVLSGGSTLFKNFRSRLEHEVEAIVNERLAESEKRSGTKPTPIPVKVVSHRFQRTAVYFGGSMLAGAPTFQTMVRTKAQYDEYGPAICRTSPTFSSLY